MLLPSLGDNHSSLSTERLQEQPSDASSDSYCGTEGSQARLPSMPKVLEGDRPHVASDEAFGASEIPSSVCNPIKSSTLVQPSQDQRSPLKVHPSASELDGLYELRQAARLNAIRKARTGSKDWGALAKLSASAVESIALDSFAAPLSPLRVRDLYALSALFQRDDVYTIEADVNHRLLSLLPEPYWEDDAFAFLQEFL